MKQAPGLSQSPGAFLTDILMCGGVEFIAQLVTLSIDLGSKVVRRLFHGDHRGEKVTTPRSFAESGLAGLVSYKGDVKQTLGDC